MCVMCVVCVKAYRTGTVRMPCRQLVESAPPPLPPHSLTNTNVRLEVEAPLQDVQLHVGCERHETARTTIHLCHQGFVYIILRFDELSQVKLAVEIRQDLRLRVEHGNKVVVVFHSGGSNPQVWKKRGAEATVDSGPIEPVCSLDGTSTLRSGA